jgi:outer membrane receptor for ferrienterochelin and colicins
MKIFFLFVLVLLGSTTVRAQDSTFNAELNEVVVTATRSERKLSNVAVPTTVISQKQIQQSGSLRLQDILGEQTGLFITEAFGKGLQMQGLSSDYTLILLNGEPFIGRMGGVLDLSRIAVGNIRKIEIVKGPSSSLYGSEALAGVVNIITDQPAADRLSATLRYGRFQTLDGSLNGSIKRGRFSATSFVNSNSSQGYTLLPFSNLKTVEPFWRLTKQLETSWQFSEKTKLAITSRYNYEGITNTIAVQNFGQTILSKGKEVNNDVNVNPVLSHRFSNRVKTQLRGYTSAFSSIQRLDVKESISNYNDEFRQTFHRIENQTDLLISPTFNMNLGGGFVEESVRSNRYDSLSTRRSNHIGYAFWQGEWTPDDRWSVIAGLRYDLNKNYASVFSPKLALRYAWNPKLSVTASVGRGFKAPDFRQLYLNFTNVAAGSYSVFGALAAAGEIAALTRDQQIESLSPSFYQLADLRPESSVGLNAGIQYRPASAWLLKANVFRNDINDLILTDVIAYKRNGGQIFSYLNVSRAFTQGVELDAQWTRGSLKLSGGYQYLVTADKDVLQQIRQGRVFTRDLRTGISKKISRSEYAGLPQRSRHMANIKMFYEGTKGWFATTRAVYRARWGTNDLDGNGLINRSDEFAPGFLLLNISGGKTFSNGVRWMAGIDNVLNYRDELNLPGQPGYQWYMSITYDFMHKHKTK